MSAIHRRRHSAASKAFFFHNTNLIRKECRAARRVTRSSSPLFCVSFLRFLLLLLSEFSPVVDFNVNIWDRQTAVAGFCSMFPCFSLFRILVRDSFWLLSAVLGGLSNNLPYKIKFIIKFITPSVSGYLYCISSVMSCPVGGKGGGASPGGVDFLFFFLFFGFLYLCPVAVYCRERRNETTTTKKKKNPLG